jgi:hypothetical protein
MKSNLSSTIALFLILVLSPSCSDKEEGLEPDNQLGELYESIISHHNIKEISAFSEGSSNRDNTYWDFPSPNYIRIGVLSGTKFYGSTYNLEQIVRYQIWSDDELFLHFH